MRSSGIQVAAMFAAGSLACVTPEAQAEASDSVQRTAQLVENGFSLNLRPRFEYAYQADKPERGRGYTMRTLAGWRSTRRDGFGLGIQFIESGRLSATEFNENPGLPSPYPATGDRNTTDFNQLFVDHRSGGGFDTRLGRQVETRRLWLSTTVELGTF
jgi:hypothetical protein